MEYRIKLEVAVKYGIYRMEFIASIIYVKYVIFDKFRLCNCPILFGIWISFSTIQVNWHRFKFIRTYLISHFSLKNQKTFRVKSLIYMFISISKVCYPEFLLLVYMQSVSFNSYMISDSVCALFMNWL